MTEETSKNHPERTEQAGDKRVFESVGEALQAGQKDGVAKAREKTPEWKEGLAEAAHDLAYGVAFGSTFAGAFLTELLPESVREGFSKGAAAGRQAGKEASGENVDSSHGTDENPDAMNPKFS